jgi:miniconductance mechanosensitive channel
MMTTAEIQSLIEQSPLLALLAAVVLSIIVYLFGRFVVGRALIYIAGRTKNKYDDIIVENLRPFRIAWLAPLGIIYGFAHLVPEYQGTVEKVALLLIMWVTAITFNSLLNAVNTIYEASPSYNGVAIQGYLDLVKLLILLIVLILSISLLTGESPIVLLTGLGAATAVLLLIFRDTILSLVASVQIAANDLLKEGDWVEVPDYGADGDVLNITLHTIKIQNWDMTISVIPTYKIVEVAYKNWRGMTESGGRRIKRAIILDMNTIKICTEEDLTRLAKIDLIQELAQTKLEALMTYRKANPETFDPPLDGPQVTNIELFRNYVEKYLRHRPDIHTEQLSLLVRSLPPSDHGLPIEVYAFTKTTAWAEYEAIQAAIFEHLIAAAPTFNLSVYQQPSSLDITTLANLNQ